MARYINASDLGKLLGSDYSFHWTTDSDVQRIIFNKRQESDIKKAIDVLPEKTISETIQQFIEPETDISKIKTILKKRKIRVPDQPDEIVNMYNKSELERVICCSKKEITQNESHSAYSKNKETFSEQLPEPLQKAVTESFNMERGNVEESRIIKKYDIPKTNKLEYYTFDVHSQKYKIGCRFDGPGVEIKTRVKRFLGVPDYEKVQIHVYMAVSNSDRWLLKEKFNDQIIDHEIFFNEFFFEKMKTDIHSRWEYFYKKNKKVC